MPADFTRVSRPVARQEHHCVECDRRIRARERYVRLTGRARDAYPGLLSWPYHTRCAAQWPWGRESEEAPDAAK